MAQAPCENEVSSAGDDNLDFDDRTLNGKKKSLILFTGALQYTNICAVCLSAAILE